MGSDNKNTNKSKYRTPPSKRSFAWSPFSSPKHRASNPYGGGGRHTTFSPLKCGLLVMALFIVATLVNMVRWDDDVATTVQVEMQDGKRSVRKAMKAYKKLQGLLNNDDKYVKVAKGEYQKHFANGDDDADVAGEERGVRGSNKNSQDEGDDDVVHPKKQRNNGGEHRDQHEFMAHGGDNGNNGEELVNGLPAHDRRNFMLEHYEEKDILKLEQKMMVNELKHPNHGYDYHQVHHDADMNAHYHYDHRNQLKTKEFNDLLKQEKWFEPEQREDQLQTAVPHRLHHPFNNRYEASHNLPPWMKDYFAWHDEHRSQLNATNWQDPTNKYLVMTCYKGYVCGNVVHRLRPVSAMLRMAYESGRLLLIFWEDKLEQFLEPPHSGGMNWHLPDYMERAVNKTQPFTDVDSIAHHAINDKDSQIVTTRLNDHLFAETYYNSKVCCGHAPADVVFRDVYNVLFKPTFMLHERIKESQHTMGLPSGEYAIVHIPYEEIPVTKAGQELLKEQVENAINCASNLRPGGPFLIAAQTFAIASLAVKYGRKHKVAIAARQISHDTLHEPKDLWNSFLEVYFMANARCVAYGNDGYGQLGYMIGYEHDCRIKYDGYGSVPKQCTWTDNRVQVGDMEKEEDAIWKMDEKKGVDPLSDLLVGQPELGENAYKSDGNNDDQIGVTAFNTAMENVDPNYHGMPDWLKKWMDEVGKDLPKDDYPWMTRQYLPEWLKAYFLWHKTTKLQLKEDNWKEHRFLVMTCYNGQKCGNVAKRLRPIMGHLRLAAHSKRLFMFHWDKPNRLEYFVRPPQYTNNQGDDIVNGIDWIVPDYMMWKVRAQPQVSDFTVILNQLHQPTRKVVNSVYNDDTYMEPWYDQRREEGEPDAKRSYRDAFDTLFQPTLLLQERINEVFEHVGIEAGNYGVAHIDFGKMAGDDNEKAELKEHVERALNCLSQLKPGGPFVALTETYEAAATATAYGIIQGVKIPAKQVSHDKHLIPHDIMGAFAEVFMMANAHCVSYGKGGFGEMGYLLGDNYDCRIKYAGPTGQHCTWKKAEPADGTAVHPDEQKAAIAQAEADAAKAAA